MHGQYQEFPNVGAGGVGVAHNTVVNHNLGGVYGMPEPTVASNHYGVSYGQPNTSQANIGVRYGNTNEASNIGGYYSPTESLNSNNNNTAQEYKISDNSFNSVANNDVEMYEYGFIKEVYSQQTDTYLTPTKISSIKIKSNDTKSIIKSIEYYKQTFSERNINPVYIIKDTEFSIVVKEKLNTDFLSIVIENIDKILDSEKVSKLISDEYNDVLTKILSGCLTTLNVINFKEEINTISAYFKNAKEEYAEDIIRVKKVFKSFIDSITYEEEDDFILCKYTVPVAYITNLTKEISEELTYVNTYEVDLIENSLISRIIKNVKFIEAIYAVVIITNVKYYASYSNVIKSIEFI